MEFYSSIQEVVKTLVYVLSVDGKPLMPCKEAKARHLLKQKRALCKKKEPFVIQLLFDCENKTQPINLGVDAGYLHIGLSATTERQELFSADVALRHDIAKLLAIRKELRRGRRNRKLRYRPARFNNRVKSKHKGWLAPSIEHRINSHIRIIQKVCKILPITLIIVEIAQFDIQKIKNPSIEGKEYQEGEQLGFWNVREYVLKRDNHTCQCCKGKSKDKVLNVHHIESRKTGGNAPNNLVTLCETCHNKYHKGLIDLPKNIKRGMSFRDTTFMNIMRPTLLRRMCECITIPIKNTYGYITKHNRIELGLLKTHYIDAYCIAGNFMAIRLDYCMCLRQVRKHNRQIHKCRFLTGGIRKRNQAPYEIFGFRLFDKVIYNNQLAFIFGRRSSGQFDIRKLDGTKISASVNYKHLQLYSRSKSFLLDRREAGMTV